MSYGHSKMTYLRWRQTLTTIGGVGSGFNQTDDNVIEREETLIVSPLLLHETSVSAISPRNQPTWTQRNIQFLIQTET